VDFAKEFALFKQASPEYKRLYLELLAEAYGVPDAA
jgi:hypothetical protein